MAKIPKHIEIVRTDVKPFGSMSQSTAEKIKAALEPQYERVGITAVHTAEDLDRLIADAPDLIYAGFKRFPPSGEYHEGGEILWLSQYLDDHGVAYTGSPREAMELELSKERAKMRVHEYGIATAQHFTAVPGRYKSADELPLPFPLFIKPLRLGQGLGVDEHSIVRSFEAFQNKVQKLHDETGGPSLVETYLTGREFSVGMLDIEGTGTPTAMPVELVMEPNEQGDMFFGFDAKENHVGELVPVKDKAAYEKVSAVAVAAFKALGARDYGRVDIRMDANGEPNFLEANLIPGPRYFPESCRINKGMDYATVINVVARLGLNRQQ